jgi:hypothetical protein
VLPRVRAITNETRVSTSARWTPSLGRSWAACLHVFPAPALCSGRDPMVACGLWRIAKAARHVPRCASGVGAAHVECGKDTHISTPVAGAMRSPQGMDHTSNLLEICPRDNHRDEHISLYP